jgi:hypothetical protein
LHTVEEKMQSGNALKFNGEYNSISVSGYCQTGDNSHYHIHGFQSNSINYYLVSVSWGGVRLEST